ncbi:MAG: NAD(P)-binding domain-containing protein [Lentisphaerae bacterium]|nr:NAD(P)-binding domain-containing protein [Lentisphaerota bacterium]
MSVLKPLQSFESSLRRLLGSGTAESPRPALNARNESNVPDLYVIGDIAGAPVIKLAMEQGYDVIEHIASLPDAKSGEDGVHDVIIVGAGASGLNAALRAKDRDLSCVVLEKEKIASTIENFPEAKWVYAEPDSVPPKGKLWLDGATKEDLLARWNQIVRENGLDVRPEDGVTDIVREGKHFLVKTASGQELKGRRVVLAIGQRGNPRKLGVPGEDQEAVYHRLYAPKHYEDEDILVVGGGNSAVEAALTLSKRNRVVLSYRRAEFARIFKDNERKLNEAVAANRVRVLLNSNVKEFGDGETVITVKEGSEAREETLPCQHTFVLVGAELPVGFLKKQGIRLEGEWTGSLWRTLGLTLLSLVGLAAWGGDSHGWSRALLGWIPSLVGAGAFVIGAGGLLYGGLRKKERFAWLGVAFLVCHAVYGVKVGGGSEFWPYRGWGYSTLSLFNRPWAFWYTVLYTILMTSFGIPAMKKWGFDRKDRYQVFRFASLISFQWILFFIVPEFLFRLAIQYRWVGEALAADPKFAGQAWRAYGIVYAWPLFFYTFFYDPHQVWVVWGVILAFVVIPVLSFFHGKRYCTWICGCGGLAETFGDRWRIFAPKGDTSIRWEKMNLYVLPAAFAITAVVVFKDVTGFIQQPAIKSLAFYKLFVDVWLVGIIPVTLYPFLGGKVWCRYWCPLAKLMGIFSHRLRGRFKIVSNDKCIACYQCSRYCQVGIPVMRFALKQESFGNWNSSCIGCGICVTVCPMDTLSFTPPKVDAEKATETGEVPQE